MGQHRPYTKQFKQQAVQLIMQQGQDVTRVARELGMPHSTLCNWLHRAGWRKPVEEGPISEDLAVLQAQVKDLRRQLKRSEMEKEILKKATAYFASQKLSDSPSLIADEGSSR